MNAKANMDKFLANNYNYCFQFRQLRQLLLHFERNGVCAAHSISLWVCARVRARKRQQLYIFGYYRKEEYETDTTVQMAEIDKVSEISFPPSFTDASKIVIKCIQPISCCWSNSWNWRRFLPWANVYEYEFLWHRHRPRTALNTNRWENSRRSCAQHVLRHSETSRFRRCIWASRNAYVASYVISLPRQRHRRHHQHNRPTNRPNTCLVHWMRCNSFSVMMIFAVWILFF